VALTAADQTPRSERRSQIVALAYQLIVERGLEGLRFGDVARAAGINNGTLLYYFPSKEALIQAVGALLVEQFSETAVPPPEGGRLDPLAELRWEFADAAERLNDQAGVVYTELLVRAQRDPTVAALLRDIDASWRGWLRSILDRGRDEGLFRADLDLDLVTTTIMACIRGVGMQALVVRDAAPVAPAMRAAAGLIEGWVVSASQEAEAPVVPARRYNVDKHRQSSKKAQNG
jgi:AcrR family transcriptional regulator